jgi:hypothetical protein
MTSRRGCHGSSRVGSEAYLTADDKTRLVPVFQGAEAKPSIEPALASRSVLASRGDRILAARVAGAAVELVVVQCRD